MPTLSTLCITGKSRRLVLNLFLNGNKKYYGYRTKLTKDLVHHISISFKLT